MHSKVYHKKKTVISRILHVFSVRVAQDTWLPVGNGSLHFTWTVSLPGRDMICSISQTHVAMEPSFGGRSHRMEPHRVKWSSELEKPNAACGFNSSHSTTTGMRAIVDFPVNGKAVRGLVLKKALCMVVVILVSIYRQGEVTWSMSYIWVMAKSLISGLAIPNPLPLLPLLPLNP